MESNQDQALMRGPPDHRANGPDIPLSGYVVSFSALLTCLSPRNSVRTCALARVEGSVPPTSGFGIRRSPLSYTRILFERVRICTSQRGSIGRVYLTTRPPGLPPSVSPYQSASTLFRHRSMVPPPASCGEERHIKHHRMDDALSGIHRTSLEPRGGNEPPRPRRRSHGCGLTFCCCTRHMCASRLIVTPASYGYAIWYFTRSGTGSFQRDSALWSSHLEYSGFIAAGPNHRGRS